MSIYIPKQIKQQVAEDANHRCGYCLTTKLIIGPLLQIEHIIPVSKGGGHERSNLWLACPYCNNCKSDHTEAVDLQSGERVPLFNPRKDIWSEHFRWVSDGTTVEGLTAMRRATVLQLQINQPDIVASRQIWVMAGWHPPTV